MTRNIHSIPVHHRIKLQVDHQVRLQVSPVDLSIQPILATYLFLLSIHLHREAADE